MYDKVDLESKWKQIEENILSFWEKNQIFERSIRQQSSKEKFIFFEGPPTANGIPGIHHVLSRIYKDFVCRYKTMQGYQVPRKAGWDTHGLPVELEVEKRLHISGKNEIETFGVKEFIEECKKSIFTYKEVWDRITKRIGYWLDIDHPYITCSNDYIESVWWALKEIYKQNLIYKGHKVVPHCPRCQTTLSSHEVAQGYEDNTPDPSIFVCFPVVGNEDVNFLVWTTTPWTLTANVAIAVKPDAKYAEIMCESKKYILAKERIPAVFAKKDYTILREMEGRDLLGLHYRAPFNYYKLGPEAHYVIQASFVGLTEGTGVVHIAPAFGLDDREVGIENNLPTLITVNIDGKFKEEIVDFKNLFVKEADPLIIRSLKEKGILLKSEQILHTYPFCWRCHSPLLYLAKDSWFIRVSSIREKLLANNETINWLPEHIKKGRFGEWLKEAKDWAISRERYWGTPLNIWVCPQCAFEMPIGSLSELKEKATQPFETIELHKPYIDEVKITCPHCSSPMNRVNDVIDCWLDSGSMSFAQNHYPFEPGVQLSDSFPADFISEGIDQTRGWFYTLLVLSTILFNSSPYKSVLTFELVLDEKGEKMSKSKGNVVNVDEVIETFGADSIRWSMFFSSTPYVTRKFSTSTVGDALRNFILPLLNVVSFFTTYANIDGWEPKSLDIPKKEIQNSIDLWILSRIHHVTGQVREDLDAYDVTGASKILAVFVDELTNWFVRRSRRRFWKSENDTDKNSAYKTLFSVLFHLSALIAPFTPFLAEYIFLTLKSGVSFSLPESVHLLPYPYPDQSWIHPVLELEMEYTRAIVSAGLRARKKSSMKARNPLSRIFVLPKTSINLSKESVDLILEECNIKELQIVTSMEEFATVSVKPNLPILGKKHGSNLSRIQEAFKNITFSSLQMDAIIHNQPIQIEYKNEAFDFIAEDILYQISGKGNFIVEEAGSCFVVIDTFRDEALIQEGMARELIHKIQNERKVMNLTVTDRIRIDYFCGAESADMIKRFEAYIFSEVLADQMNLNPSLDIPSEETEEIRIKLYLSSSSA